MIKCCKQSGEEFEVTDWDLSLLEELAPSFDGVRYSIALPTLSPQARLQRRLAFRNHTFVYRRKCSKSGKMIIADFAPDAPFPVYENSAWISDDWDAIDYGREFDFNRPFFEQFKELRDVVPHIARGVINVENSDYSTNSSDIKDCYLVFASSNASSCMYGENVWGSKDCIDCTNTTDSELCYDCVMCARCYGLQSSVNCQDCSSSYFLLGCRSCKNCFGCANLQHQEYCIFNVQYSKEEYEQYLAGLNLKSRKSRNSIKSQVVEFWSTQPQPHFLGRRADDCTGNYIFDSARARECFMVRDAEDVHHCYVLNGGTRKCLDCAITGRNSELMYESGFGVINLSHLLFTFRAAQNCSNLIYCWTPFNIQNCFGCVGLKNKQFCILNKQYTEAEYNKLVPRIIEHMMSTKEWGEFFPMWLSPVPYNRSLANRFFPMTEKEIKDRDLWYYDAGEVEIGADISEVPDVISENTKAFTALSEVSNRPFRITQEEILKLRRLGAPLPTKSYDLRMQSRSEFLGGVRLLNRKCAKTGIEIQTAFGPELPWQIWDKSEYDRVLMG